MFAVQASNIVELVRAKLPAHGFFLVQDGVSSWDRWEGEKPTRCKWRPGAVAYLPARSEVSCTPDQPYREILLSMDDALLIETAREYIERSHVDTRYSDITSPEISDMVQLLQRMVVSGEYRNWPLLTDSLQLALSAAVVRRFAPKEAGKVDAIMVSMSAPKQRNAIDFVEANIGRRIHLKDMASAANMSPYHFSRSFKKVTGKTPTRYVIDRRMRESQLLLKSSRMSLAEIALHCGWGSQSHFTTTFKQILGVTPGKFRSTVASVLASDPSPFTEPIVTTAKLVS
ncbi:AraC family transcriptional regulator [Pseudomonas phage Dolphis]|nr:AraC family transcriptional regulator [Pseudomonas phage Dolphis]